MSPCSTALISHIQKMLVSRHVGEIHQNDHLEIVFENTVHQESGGGYPSEVHELLAAYNVEYLYQ